MLKDFDGSDTLCIGGNWGLGRRGIEKEIGIIGIKQLEEGKLFVGLAQFLDEAKWITAKNWEMKATKYSDSRSPIISLFVTDDTRLPHEAPCHDERKGKWPVEFVQTVAKHIEYNAEHILLGSRQKSSYENFDSGRNRLRLSGSLDSDQRCRAFHLSLESFGREIDHTGLGTKNDLILDPNEMHYFRRPYKHESADMAAFIDLLCRGFEAAGKAGHVVRLNWADIQPRMLTPEELEKAKHMAGLADYLGMLGVPHTRIEKAPQNSEVVI